jgi:hypothetical protein
MECCKQGPHIRLDFTGNRASERIRWPWPLRGGSFPGSLLEKGGMAPRASRSPLAGGMILQTASAAGRHSAERPQV